MRIIIIIGVLICATFIEVVGQNLFSRKSNSKENYINPSGLAGAKSASKGYEKSPFGLGTDVAVRSTNSAENSQNVPLLARRFVNFLLNKAHIKDSKGNTVPLEDITLSELDEMSLAIVLVGKPSELVTLRDFGMKKRNLTVGQIDALFASLFSSAAPHQQWYDGFKVWSLNGVWDAVLERVDGLKVLHAGIILCLLWILKRIFEGKSNWKILLLGVLVASVIWEAVQMLEEETIKQYSEQLRQGDIPEHCLGIDNRSWWQILFGGNEKEICYKYHFHKDSNPALKISYLKVVLNQFKLVVDVLVYALRNLLAGYESNWFWSNVIYQIIICSTLGFCIIAYMVIRLNGWISLPFFLSIRGGQRPENQGSHVQNLHLEDSNSAPVRPPPRRKNGNKKMAIESDVADGSSSSSTVIFNVRSGSFHFTDPNLARIETEKEGMDHMIQEEEKICTRCKHNAISEKGDSLSAADEKNNISIKEDVSRKKEESESDHGDEICATKEKSSKRDNSGGDTQTTVEKVLY